MAVLDAEVGVVLVPGGAFAVAVGLEEDPVGLPDDGVPDELADGEELQLQRYRWRGFGDLPYL